MKLLNNNKKLILGFILGLVLSGITVYAASEILFQSSQVSFDNTRANLTKSNGDPVETVEEAIEALANGGGSSSSACSNSPFQRGDYIDMTPTATSFTPSTSLTGLEDYDTFKGNAAGTTTVAGTLNPSYLNVWRVIRINSDCTVEVVSEYVSDVNVKFAHKTGYKNYVYYLNEIAKQYANTTYTLDPSTAPDGAFRNVGYDGQTKQIDESATLPSGYTTHPLADTTLGTASGKWYQKTSPLNGQESLGGGDQKFITDIKLLDDAGVSLVAYIKGSTATTTLTTYWLASRLFGWYGASEWYFYARYVHYSGYISSSTLWCRRNSSFSASTYSYAVRPIVTLKSGLTTSSGDGTSGSHYVLSAS